MADWQPIETAPQDGSAFIGLIGRLVYTVHWQQYYDKWPHQEGGPTFRGGWSREVHDAHYPCSPTHWMPFPDKPSTPLSGEY